MSGYARVGEQECRVKIDLQAWIVCYRLDITSFTAHRALSIE
jgi:hypothetical protein